MNPRLVIIACLCAVLFVAAVYFGGKHVLEQGRVEESTPPVESVKKPPTVVVEPEVEIIDSTPPPQTEPECAVKAEPEAPVANAVDTVQAVDAEDDGLVERFLPDGTPVPKHLRLPKKWVGIGMSAVSSMPEEVYEEIHNWLHEGAREIVAKYNPNRPIAEVWPKFMVAERQYIMQSPDADKPYYLGFGAGQVDFVYNQIWDFPEVFAIHLSEGIDGIHFRIHEVELGVREPDWNYVELPDHACIPLWCSCEYYDDKDKAKKILRDRYSWFCRQEEAGMLQEMMQLDLMAVLLTIGRITRLFAVCVTYLGHDVVREVATEVESKHSLSEEFLNLCHKTFLSESSLNKSRPQDYPCPFCLAPRSGVPTRGISTIPVTEE